MCESALSQFHVLSFLTPCFLKTIFLIKSWERIGRFNISNIKSATGGDPEPVPSILHRWTYLRNIHLNVSLLSLSRSTKWMIPKTFPNKENCIHYSYPHILNEKHSSNICVPNCRTGFQCCLFFGHKKREWRPVLLRHHKCVPIFTKDQRNWTSGTSVCLSVCSLQ
jgi:hypothetical protein